MHHHTHATKTKTRKRAVRRQAQTPLILLFEEFEIPVDLAHIDVQPTLIEDLVSVTVQLDAVVTTAETIPNRDPLCVEVHRPNCDCTGAMREAL